MNIELQNTGNEFSRIEDKRQETITNAANSISKLEFKEIVNLDNMRKATRYENIIVTQNKAYKWGITNINGEVIVPFGKYGWIDGFDSGLARVRTHGETGRKGNTVAIVNLLEPDDIIVGNENIQQHINKDRIDHPEKYAKWGIINEKGEEVLPLIYDDIYSFAGKNRYSTTVVINGEKHRIYFKDLNPDLLSRENEPPYASYYHHDHNDDTSDNFSINDCYDEEGNLDYDRLEDAAMDGEYQIDD